MSRDALARRAVAEALRLRARCGRSVDQPVCPIELALECGVDVRFESISSLEGMYTPDGPLIVLGSLRPPGRRAYTCAHELGHHVFGHGLRVDELLDSPATPGTRADEEYLADRFAAALLMPKLAILGAFTRRDWDPSKCTAEQVYAIAGLFGVGYRTLLGYMERTLGVVPASLAQELKKDSPKAIRSRLLGADCPGNIIVVDAMWRGRPVDCDVGDLLVVPPESSTSGETLERAGGRLFRATRAGITRLAGAAVSIEVRVARAGYSGLAVFRHLEESDDEL